MSVPTPPHTYWKLLAPLGLSLIGAGISIAIDAGIQRYAGAEFWTWVLEGTFGLVVMNAGVSVFGDAVKRRIWDETLKRERAMELESSSE